MSAMLFRPPAEADSLILRIEQGCPHNQCAFCGMYKDVPYRKLGMDAIRRLSAEYARGAPETRRIFLADGDVMRRSFDELAEILRLLNDAFPELARISVYANGSSIAAKTDDELRRLRALKLRTLYMGLESGSERVLRQCRKGERVEEMVAAGSRAQLAGMRMSVMVLLGLGGVAHSEKHAALSAAALNRMQPRLLSALRVIPVEGTGLHADVVSGRFDPLTEYQVVRELRGLLAGLALRGTVFRANHTSNVIPLEGRFPQDQPRLLAELDRLLVSGALDKETPGALPLWL
jgi:radical SAM superfamily enzyme YgiQ (UPF0313 family)